MHTHTEGGLAMVTARGSACMLARGVCDAREGRPPYGHRTYLIPASALLVAAQRLRFVLGTAITSRLCIRTPTQCAKQLHHRY